MGVISVRFAAGAALLGLCGVLDSSCAQERQNEPGKFDFYMLALSWSPSFCADSAERLPAGSGQRVDPMRGAASFLCGPWPVAAIRERVPGILRSAGAATQSYHRLVHDRPDAVVQPDLS
jgi:ribonuclease I